MIHYQNSCVCSKQVSNYIMRSLHYASLKRVLKCRLPYSLKAQNLVRQSSSFFLCQDKGTLHSKISYCSINSRNLSSNASSDVTTDIRDGGKSLAIDFKQKEPMIFPSVWLRFNCHCPSCKQQHSGQRLVDVADIDIDTLVKSTEISENGDVLHIEWTDHKGQIPIKFLKENKLSVSESGEKFSWILDDDLTITKMTYSDMISNDTNKARFLREINERGLCLLTGVPTEEDMVARVAENFAPVQRTIYGLTFPVRDVPNPINIAYSTAYLPLHNDLHHYESGPGLFFLHCQEFEECVEGGESILLDVNRVAEEFRIQHPEDFKILTQNAVTIQKVHYERDWPVDMTYKRPHIKLNDKDEIVAVCWAPPFEAPFSGKLEDVEPYYKAYHKFAKAVKYSPNIFKFKLRPGDCIVFNNRRILHGREEFVSNGGSRYLQGCYINIDEFKSQVKVLCKLSGDHRPVKPVGNGCWITC
ncbi:2-(trimethylamino)ethylphosphonate dioxygenase-like isoform X2 [Mytilus edulis]|uniref:2-(trimethylamino)ethylphosphonate dioxygenase-like isoform X2 n=1 Tax=Mytilus edulis TaxID=6550 RepID=UPI0039EFAD7B